MLDVAAGRRRIGMPELRLDHVDRHVLRGEFGGMRMAETVRMDTFLNPGAAREAGEELSDI